jgi:hypothetical protein
LNSDVDQIMRKSLFWSQNAVETAKIAVDSCYVPRQFLTPLPSIDFREIRGLVRIYKTASTANLHWKVFVIGLMLNRIYSNKFSVEPDWRNTQVIPIQILFAEVIGKLLMRVYKGYGW